MVRPATVEEAVAYLAAHKGARCISGGATLVAMMNASLVDPAMLISLDNIDAMKGISRDIQGAVRIGA